MRNSHPDVIRSSRRQRHLLVAPFMLLALLGCAREAPKTDIPAIVAPNPTNLSLGLQAQDGVAAPGNYLILPLSWQANGEQISALEAELKLDPAQLELVGVQDESGTLSHVEAGEPGTFLVTTLLNTAASSQQVKLVLRMIGSSPTPLSVRLTQAVDSQGRSADLSTGAPQRQLTVAPGEGGQTERPPVAVFEQQLQAIQQSRGLIDAQALTVKPLKVPITLDPSWSPYELGDIDQNRSVNLADTALLTRFLTGQQVPTSYQAYASDLLDAATSGAQQVDALDLVALLAKNALTAFKINASVPSVHPLSVSANPTQAGLVLVGNAGYGPLNVSAIADQPWITVQRQPPVAGSTTTAFNVTAAADAGSNGTITLSFPNNVKRTVKVLALAPVADPNQIVGQFTATLQPGFSGLNITQNRPGPLKLSAAAPVWDPASHVFASDVTLTNSGSAALPGVRAILRAPQPDTLRVINPSGYASDDAAFIEFGPVAAGASQTVKWRIYSPNDTVGSFRVDVTSVAGSLGLSTAAPASFSAAADTVVTVRGTDIRAETAFFIESTKLVVRSWTATSADVVVPAGFPAATYGVMAANPNGERAVLYPAFTITPAPAPTALDPKTHARSFVDGYVTDVTTRNPIAGAIVSLPGLSTTTTSDGYFLLRGVPQGRQAVRIDADGYERVYRFAEVQGEQQTVTLKLAELQPKSTAVTMIGAEGGTHYANDGSFLKIPAGALDQTVPIEFTQLSAANALPSLPQDGYFLAFARLGPIGLTFKKPATLFLPLQPGIVAPVGTPIRISYFDERQGQWVQDITGGVIVNIGGRLFLQYEINHFTWIGGNWFAPNPVRGRVLNFNGSPAVNIPTNFSVTDKDGYYEGSFSGGGASEVIRAFVYNRIAPGVEALTKTGGELVIFPDIVFPRYYQFPSFTPNTPQIVINNPCNSVSAGAARQIVSTQSVSVAQETSDLIFTDSAILSSNITIENSEFTDVDMSRTIVLLNGQDITQSVDIIRKEVQKTIRTEFKTSLLKLKYGENQVELQFFSRSLGKSITRTKFYRVNRFSTSSARAIVLPDDQFSPEDKTPIFVQASGIASYTFRESDILNNTLHVPVTVTALDDTGNIIDMTTRTRYKIKGSGYLGSYDDAKNFILGVATPTVSINVAGPITPITLLEIVPDTFYGDGVSASVIRPLNTSPCGQTDRFQFASQGPIVLDFQLINNPQLLLGGPKALWDAINKFTSGLSLIDRIEILVNLIPVPFVGDLLSLTLGAYDKLQGKDPDKLNALLSAIGIGIDATNASGVTIAASETLAILKSALKSFGQGPFRDALEASFGPVLAALKAGKIEDAKALLNIAIAESKDYANLYTKYGSETTANANRIALGLRVASNAGNTKIISDTIAMIENANRLGLPNLPKLAGDVGELNLPGFNKLMNDVRTANSKVNLEGIYEQLRAVNALPSQGITPTALESKGLNGFIFDGDVIGKVSIPSPETSYLKIGQTVADQVKASPNALKFDLDGKTKSSQLEDLAIWVRSSPNTNVGRVVITGRVDELRQDKWDYITGIGLKLVDVDGRLIPRPKLP